VRAGETSLTGKIWNLGAGNPQPVNRLVELLSGEVVYIPKRPGEPDATHADITAITRDLGWGPKISFELGVSNILKQIDYWREAPLWDPQSIAQASKVWFKYMAGADVHG
jgi:UDP-glucose 4-epimerase